MSESQESSATPTPSAGSSSASRTSSAHSDQPAPRKTSRAAPARPDRAETKLLAITIDTDTGRVVRLEGFDATGNRHELSETDRATLTTREREDRLEDLVEQAFEAGIACVLGGDMELDAAAESPEDVVLRRRLLAPLIERSTVRHLLDSAVLNRAILRTLIEQQVQPS